MVVPVLGRVKDEAEMLIGNDDEAVEHLMLERLNHPFDVS